MNYLLLVLMGIAAGGAIVVQGAMNAALTTALKHPLVACFFNFAVGTLVLLCASFVIGVSPFVAVAGGSGPWWPWLGGLLGAGLVVAIAIMIPTVGAANTFVLIVAGQAVTALVFDHYGWLGVPQQSLSVMRVVGTILVVLGVVLVRR